MRLTLDEVQKAKDSGSVLVDIRKSTSFGAAFIHGSINIGLTPSSANWLTQVVHDRDKELVLVSDYEAEVMEAVEQFKGAGYQNIRGFLDGGVSAWAAAGKDLDHLPQLTVHSLKVVLERYPDHVLLDVRSDDEWAEGHHEAAQHQPISKLIQEGIELDRSRHVTTMCGSGYRSNIAGSYLKSLGFAHAYSVLGGMAAWRSIT